MAKLSDIDLRSIVSSAIADADSANRGELSTQRALAMQYYLAEPFGNEVRGRSSVVMSEVSDVVESVLPSLLRIFTAGTEIVRFEPVGREDEDQARQRTDFANHVFLSDNPGFHILNIWFKDALIQKNGFVKVWYNPNATVAKERYNGLTDLQFQALLNDPDIRLVGHDERVDSVPDPMSGQSVPIVLHDVDLRITKKRGRIVVENVPPEEFMISSEADAIKGARFVGHRTRKLQGELIEAGYGRKEVESLPTWAEWGATEYAARYQNDSFRTSGHSEDYNSRDPSMRPIAIVEGYIWVDRDGDGIAELRKITAGGTGSATQILDDEEWDDDRAPLYSVCPIPLPHRFFGLSQADLVMDLQLVKSTLVRQLLDNLYIANNGRTVVNVNSLVDLDDVLISRPQQIIRTYGDPSGTIMPIPHASLPPAAFNMIEYLDGVRETRTGVTRYNQGMDADSLNKTASGISQIMGAAQQRIELIARIFAETGVKELFEGIDHLAMTYQDHARTVRLRNQWVEVDPRDWKGKMDATVRVGLGTGNQQERTAQVMAVQQDQVMLLQAGKGHMVSDSNIYNLLSKKVETAGLKDAAAFFTEPNPDQPPPPPPPDPKMLEVQAKIEADKMKAQADIELARQKAMADIALQREKMQAELAMDQARLRQELEIAAQEAQIKMAVATQDAAMKREIAALSAGAEAANGGGQPANG